MRSVTWIVAALALMLGGGATAGERGGVGGGLRYADRLRTILPRHEQGGAFAAQGYARSTGKPGVCMATSGVARVLGSTQERDRCRREFGSGGL